MDTSGTNCGTKGLRGSFSSTCIVQMLYHDMLNVKTKHVNFNATLLDEPFHSSICSPLDYICSVL